MNKIMKNKILSVVLSFMVAATLSLSVPFNVFAKDNAKISATVKGKVKIYISVSKNGKYKLIKGGKYSAGVGNTYFLKSSKNKVKWSVSNADIATVSKNGKLTLKKVGKTKIFVAYKGGKKTGTEFSVKEFNGGNGTKAKPYKVANALQFKSIGNNLSKHFVLVKDIDFSNEKDMKPIGSFVPVGKEGEDAEKPVPEKAFTGSLDGKNHKLSNIKLGAPEDTAVGLFGCATNKASVSNLKIENINVQGSMLVGGVIGFATGDAVVNNLTLSGKNEITGAVGMVGGVIGGSSSSTVNNSKASANLTVTGGKEGESTGVGVIVGGGEDTNLNKCNVSNSKIKVAGENFFGVGSIAGCAHGSEMVKDCSASDVEITTGKNNMLIGGLVGYAGSITKDKTTVLENCVTKNVSIKAGENSSRIGGILGGGFYLKSFAKQVPEPAAFSIVKCKAGGDIEGGEIVGTIVGYLYKNSSVKDSESTVTLMGKKSDKTVGADDKTLALDKLK